MRMLLMELRKEKRTGVIWVLCTAGILGALYAALNFAVRKETLLNLPIAPMDMLLTQLYGMIVILNLFGIVVAACMIYHMEFRGNAIQKMYLLPVNVSGMYLCKFLILSCTLLLAVAVQHLALWKIGITDLPGDTFDMGTLLVFAAYSFLTSMPVLSFAVLVSSRSSNLWVPLGVGVAGFLSGMALAASDGVVWMLHPFVLMLKPAVAMSARPDRIVIQASLAETITFLAAGLLTAKKMSAE